MVEKKLGKNTAITPSERVDAAKRRARLSGVEPVQPPDFGWTKMAETTLNDGPHYHNPTPEESAAAVLADKDSPLAGAKGPVPGQPFAGLKVPDKLGEKSRQTSTIVDAADPKANPPAGVTGMTPEGLPVTGHSADTGLVPVVRPDFGIADEIASTPTPAAILARATGKGAIAPATHASPGAGPSVSSDNAIMASPNSPFDKPQPVFKHKKSKQV